MQDPLNGSALAAFLSRFQASIVMLSGRACGTHYPVDQARITLGRGPGVDLAFDDAAMAREHAVIEFTGQGFSLSCMEPRLQILLNGGCVPAGELKDGDRFELGSHAFEFNLEARLPVLGEASPAQ